MSSVRTTWVCTVRPEAHKAKAVVKLLDPIWPPELPTAVHEFGLVTVAVDPDGSDG